ncbi:hypothetical protein BU14_0148s0013 [Porphyra umbilicalis]|uniref:Uncharacterized protein n=1 Tax=Porphyra umbilicalis TaxID=2786 RepID=A0A1X6P9D1_PORUM|nr:hypothetical protein BU14_0148s0013 [Porphyra umbilicalis]|eukprot:OSX77437.1 hypothetical protein BU14_0148s0013 [Porphyra umbilicalis]
MSALTQGREKGKYKETSNETSIVTKGMSAHRSTRTCPGRRRCCITHASSTHQKKKTWSHVRPRNKRVIRHERGELDGRHKHGVLWRSRNRRRRRRLHLRRRRHRHRRRRQHLRRGQLLAQRLDRPRILRVEQTDTLELRRHRRGLTLVLAHRLLQLLEISLAARAAGLGRLAVHRQARLVLRCLLFILRLGHHLGNGSHGSLWSRHQCLATLPGHFRLLVGKSECRRNGDLVHTRAATDAQACRLPRGRRGHRGGDARRRAPGEDRTPRGALGGQQLSRLVHIRVGCPVRSRQRAATRPRHGGRHRRRAADADPVNRDGPGPTARGRPAAVQRGPKGRRGSRRKGKEGGDDGGRRRMDLQPPTAVSAADRAGRVGRVGRAGCEEGDDAVNAQTSVHRGTVEANWLCAHAAREEAPQQPKKQGGSPAVPEGVRAGPASQRLTLGGLEGGVRTGSLRPPPPWPLERGKTPSSLDTWPSPSAPTGVRRARPTTVIRRASQAFDTARMPGRESSR